MTSRKLFLLPGDGIGIEIMAEIPPFLHFLNQTLGLNFEWEEGLVGGAAYDAYGCPISENDIARAHAADAVLFGAVGGPKWADLPYEKRPELGLLRLRQELKVYANLRPILCYKALVDASSLKPELVEGLDLLIVRELTGGVYFSTPKEIIDLGSGQKRAIDTQIYETYEIERISSIAFELARKRRHKVTSMEKHNVMKTGLLWRQVVTKIHQNSYPDITLEHMLADSGTMQLVRQPKQFDVIVADNLFGDLLSDIAAMLTGSLGMLPSASLGAINPLTQKRKTMYEPVHGSAPDIAGKGQANPIAMIASLAMCLRYSFHLDKVADHLEKAIASVLEDGLRTVDLYRGAGQTVSTSQMGKAIFKKFQKLYS
ncbi:3-isopropylmalate dehydrogenase [Bartonella sp. DGB2]|uniref:3-isopropylmalate dehydrogenase n=1 Tax=Bartonella sp. DGB2 TaxID=3388426 RepID=UPI00398FA47E